MTGLFSKFTLFLIHKPGLVLSLGFAAIILVGALLLSLPQATVSGGISFIDALFTAVSAVCVTGLSVIDTGSNFTRFGQIVILGLIQIGALGIMSVAVIFIMILRQKMRVSYEVAFKKMLNMEFITESMKLIKFIIISTFILETIGALFLLFFWRIPELGTGNQIFYSIFHSVSAFANAGFSLFDDNLKSFNDDLSLNIIIMFLIIFGGLGFLVLTDIKDFFIGHIRDKVDYRRLHVHTKIMLIASLILIIIGALGLLFFEKGNPDFAKSPVLSSYFQSVTARTAGFSTVDIGGLTTPSYLLLIFLMFIGGGAGSTAGGVKITTIIIILALVISFIRNRRELSIFGRAIPVSNIFGAVVIFTLAILILFVFSIWLLYTETGRFYEIIFEAVSAFGTVGLSTGITPHLTLMGKILIMLLMFIGRIGPLAIALITGREIKDSLIRYPHERIIIG